MKPPPLDAPTIYQLMYLLGELTERRYDILQAFLFTLPILLLFWGLAWSINRLGGD
jgi:hypothetical protein